MLGSTLLGWSITLALVVQNAYRRREPWAWWAIGSGLVSSFVLDTLLSYAAGVMANVLVNCVILAAVGLPLLLTWNQRTR